jgi:hypothetical protein
MNRSAITSYLKNFNIDINDVGTYIAQGGQHYVFHYKTSQVIKIPKKSLLMRLYGMYNYETIVKSYQTAKIFFGEYLLDSEILSDKQGKTYIIIEKFLNTGQVITTKNFADIRQHFDKILDQNRLLKTQNQQCLDIMSFYGTFRSIIASLLRQKNRAVIENILVTNENGKNNLKIIDFNLLEVRFINMKISPVHWLVDHLFYLLAKILLNDNFEIRNM